MTAASLLYDYGLPLVFITALLSCLAVPIPASLVFMAAGTIAASGEFDVATLWVTGLSGAIIGDQIGFLAGARLSPKAESIMAGNGRIAASLRKAHEFEQKWGNQAIFLSRWLASPLGPWINLSSGLVGVPWRRFILWDIAGETVWVSLYLAIGYFFSTQAQAIADMIGNTIWLVIAAAVAYLLVGQLRKAMGEPVTNPSSGKAG